MSSTPPPPPPPGARGPTGPTQPPAGDSPGEPPAGAAAEASSEAPAEAWEALAGGRRGTRFVFVDTETTGLDFRRHELTEVAWIVRYEDGTQAERRFFPQHTIDGADAAALELTHYHERIAPQPRSPASEWLTLFLEDARGAVLVGAVPDFDARHLQMAAYKLGLEPTWDHHLLDVETLALPLIAPAAEAPRSLAKTCRALGVPHDPDQAHGALYDAQQAMRAFDAVWDLVARLRADAAALPPPVPRDNGRNHAGNDRDAGPASAHDDRATGPPGAEQDHEPPAQPGTATSTS